MPFVDSTKLIIDAVKNTVQVDRSQNIKAVLKHEMGTLDWEYNSSATLKANLFLRHKYLVFDSTAKLDADARYRLKVVLSRGSVSEYKLMKSVLKHVSGVDFLGKLVDWVTYSKIGKLVVLVIVLIVIFLITLPFLSFLCVPLLHQCKLLVSDNKI